MKILHNKNILKMSRLFVLAVSLLILNPRITLDDKSNGTSFIVSCSTGWSLHWKQDGLFGVYSLDSASQVISTLNIRDEGRNKNNRESRYLSYQKAREMILRECKS